MARVRADELVAFLSGDTWPFHGRDVVEPGVARQWVDEGRFWGEDNRAFWVMCSGERVGLARLMDLGDNAPLFDLRIRSEHRGRGLGAQTLTWLTRYVFDEFPLVRRVEGNTRQDNAAMRRTFRRCGYVQEAHHREAWPAATYVPVGIFRGSLTRPVPFEINLDLEKLAPPRRG